MTYFALRPLSGEGIFPSVILFFAIIDSMPGSVNIRYRRIPNGAVYYDYINFLERKACI